MRRVTSAPPRGSSTSAVLRGGVVAAAAVLAALLLVLTGCRMPVASEESAGSGTSSPTSPNSSGSPSSSGSTPAPGWPGGDTNQQPTPVDPLEANLSDIKTELEAYHDSGRYLTDVAAMAADAQACMVRARAGVPKPALVLDIDETALSNYTWMLSVDFLRNSPLLSSLFAEHANQADTPALPPTLELYRAARAAGVTVFFITGRSTKLQKVTEENLREVGYTEFGPSTFADPDAPPAPSVVPYKSGARAKIEQQGYTVIANVGDQNSDLEGGAGECQHKLPNPYYYIP